MVQSILTTLLILSCSTLSSANTLKVGLVLDKGGKDDKSFNSAAYLGAKKAEQDLKIDLKYVEATDTNAIENLHRAFARKNFDLVIGIGFAQQDAVKKVAAQFPKVKFAVVDSDVKAPNVRSLLFEEHEGSFLVGALAAMASKTNSVGFVGGMDIALIHKFEAGYRAGVQHVCPDCDVIVNYAGVTPEAFRNPGRGKEMALAMYNQGVNVIFHASGSTGLGVFEAARTTGKLGIGVDADQYSEAPGHVLTSMVKGIDESVFQAVKAVKEGTFTGGIQQFGLAENGVGYVYDANNKALIPDAVRATLNALTADIIAGRITVPSTRPGTK